MVPPAMLRRIFFFHRCSKATTRMPKSSGRPCQLVKTASFRQKTTSRPMTGLFAFREEKEGEKAGGHGTQHHGRHSENLL